MHTRHLQNLHAAALAPNLQQLQQGGGSPAPPDGTGPVRQGLPRGRGRAGGRRAARPRDGTRDTRCAKRGHRGDTGRTMCVDKPATEGTAWPGHTCWPLKSYLRVQISLTSEFLTPLCLWASYENILLDACPSTKVIPKQVYNFPSKETRNVLSSSKYTVGCRLYVSLAVLRTASEHPFTTPKDQKPSFV